MDDVKSVHLLALVLVKSLGLDVEDGVNVKLYAFLSLNVIYKLLLLKLLDLIDGIENLVVILELKEFFKILGISGISVADGI